MLVDYICKEHQTLFRMKKSLLVIAAVFGFLIQSNAQNRYVSQNAFSSVVVTPNVTYGTAVNVLGQSQPLLMDVYTPSGDVANRRATVIMIHSGSFLPSGTSPSAPTSWGNKGDSAMVEICTQLARRGFTAISMTHRLGWNPAAPTPEQRAAGIIQAVYRATQDLRTCIRFLKLDAFGANLYKVDTNAITVGGSSSGAYVAIHGSALNKASEVTGLPKFQFLDASGASYPPFGTPMINQTNPTPPSAWGTFTPFLGGFTDGSNQGPRSNYQLVWNIGGAVGDTSWIEAGEQPIISMHGPFDPTTPYRTAVVNVAGTGNAIVQVSGSRDVTVKSLAVGNIPASITGVNDNPLADSIPALRRFLGPSSQFNGGNPANGINPGWAGFEPFNWYNAVTPNQQAPLAPLFALNPNSSKSRALLYIDTMLRYFIPRAVRVLNLDTASVLGVVDEQTLAGYVAVFPNPATDQLNLSVEGSDLTIIGYRMFDMTGREISRKVNQREKLINLSRNGLDRGLYLLQVETDRGVITKKVMLD